MMSVMLFGIKNCDTVKKARAWLESRGIAYIFHDYKIMGIDRAYLMSCCKAFGWEKVLNRAGTTFRGLTESDKQALNETKAIALMLTHPALVKRPIIIRNTEPLAVGFKPAAYAEIFDK